MTREEAFEAMHQMIIGLQRSRALTFEQVEALNHAVIDYGSACATDAARAVRLERQS